MRPAPPVRVLLLLLLLLLLLAVLHMIGMHQCAVSGQGTPALAAGKVPLRSHLWCSSAMLVRLR
jgi:hypothetical protein